MYSHFLVGNLQIGQLLCQSASRTLFRSKDFDYCHYKTKKRWISRNIAVKSPTYYYDILGLTPSATQTQIKSAYYQMSKLHHPDVSECKKSHSLFTEINEAYEVLGDIRKRRMYDHGLNYSSGYMNPNQRGYSKTYRDDNYENIFNQHNFERKERPPPPRGHTRVYNFDEYYRQHYNEVRERRANEYKEYMRHQEQVRQDRKAQAEQPSFGFVIAFWITILLTATLLFENRDKDHIGPTKTFRTSQGTTDPLKTVED